MWIMTQKKTERHAKLNEKRPNADGWKSNKKRKRGQRRKSRKLRHTDHF